MPGSCTKTFSNPGSRHLVKRSHQVSLEIFERGGLLATAEVVHESPKWGLLPLHVPPLRDRKIVVSATAIGTVIIHRQVVMNVLEKLEHSVARITGRNAEVICEMVHPFAVFFDSAGKLDIVTPNL